jgi:hypothetical protein
VRSSPSVIGPRPFTSHSLPRRYLGSDAARRYAQQPKVRSTPHAAPAARHNCAARYVATFGGYMRVACTMLLQLDAIAPDTQRRTQYRNAPPCNAHTTAFHGGEPADTRSSPSILISRMAYCRAFGTHYELTGGQPQSQPAHNQTTVGLAQACTHSTDGGDNRYTVHAGNLCRLPEYCCKIHTHAPTGTQEFTITGTHTFTT